MGNKKKSSLGVSLRKPPPADLDQFVSLSRTSMASDIRELAPTRTPEPMVLAAREDMTVTTETGRELREVTVYLPLDLARRLSMRCTEHDRDVSNLVADAVSAHLAPSVAEAPVIAAPAKSHARASRLPDAHAVIEWGRAMTALLRARLVGA
jgi:hypothetical protein